MSAESGKSNAMRTPLHDVRDLAENLFREADLACAGLEYARLTKNGRIKAVPVGTPEHIDAAERYLRELAGKANSVLVR